ncbi:MAG TPA: STAS domain-containing protein [Solirubrobacteraceae bacterium]|nr:STAS domain-containing protein [Solirubrobacteraceae bacterium]
MTAPSLDVTRADAETVVIAVAGAVALAEARGIEAALLAQVRQGCRLAVIDLRGVTSIGAGLLGALLRIRRGLSRIDGDLALVVDGPPASELVRTTMLAALMPVAASRRDALAALARPPAAAAVG